MVKFGGDDGTLSMMLINYEENANLLMHGEGARVTDEAL